MQQSKHIHFWKTLISNCNNNTDDYTKFTEREIVDIFNSFILKDAFIIIK